MADIVSSCEKDGQQGSETEILRECDESRPSRSLLPGHETNPPYLCHLSVSGCHWKGTYWAPSPLSLFLPPTVPSSFPLLLFLDLSISLDSTLTVCTASGSKNRRTGWCVCYEEGKRESRGKRRERWSRWRTRDGTHQTNCAHYEIKMTVPM